LPPAGSVKDLSGERTEILNSCRIKVINSHLVKSVEDRAPSTISDTANSLNFNGELDIRNDSGDDCAANIKSNIVQDNGIGNPEGATHRNMSAAPILSGMIQPTRTSKRPAEQVLVTVNAMKTWRKKGINKL